MCVCVCSVCFAVHLLECTVQSNLHVTRPKINASLNVFLVSGGEGEEKK